MANKNYKPPQKSLGTWWSLNVTGSRIWVRYILKNIEGDGQRRSLATVTVGRIRLCQRDQFWLPTASRLVEDLSSARNVDTIEHARALTHTCNNTKPGKTIEFSVHQLGSQENRTVVNRTRHFYNAFQVFFFVTSEEYIYYKSRRRPSQYA